MGGKSRSSQSTTNRQQTANIVNDGTYAGVGGSVSHDESSYEDNSDSSVNIRNDIDNSIRSEYDFRDDSDNSIRNDIDNSSRFEDRSDNSSRFEDRSDSSSRFEDRSDNSTRIDDNSDYSSRYEDRSDSSTRIDDNSDSSTRIDDNSDNSIRYDGMYAGAGNVTVVDGGAVENAFDFGRDALAENGNVLVNAVDSVSNVATGVVQSLVESQEAAYRFAEINSTSAMDAMESASSSYATSLGAFADSFVEGLSGAQLNNSDNASKQLEVIAGLAKSTALEGQDIVAENSTKLALYFGGAVALVAVAAAFMSGKG